MCTANLIRSPMAAGLLGQYLCDTGRQPRLASAGLLEGGHPAAPHAVAVLAERGIDLSGHRSRRLSVDLVEAADLVLGMENRHVRAVATLHRAALGRTFTLKDFLRRADAVGRRTRGESVAGYGGRLAHGRDLAQLVHDEPADAVADPVGRPRAHFERCAQELERLVREVRSFLWDAIDPAGGTPS